MKPYFEAGGIALFHGDCRDILPTLPTESMDLIITDPPYGVRWQSGRRNLEFDRIVGDDSTEAALAAIPLALRVLRRQRHVYLFGRYDLSSVAGIGEPAELIWDKGRVGLGDTEKPWGQSHEYIQFFANCKSGRGMPKRLGVGAARMRRGSVLTVERPNGAGVSRHPTEKPIRLLRELIESSSKIGESVLDCFVGSGSTLEAAHLEGRTAIGIEIEERYCEIAATRLSQVAMNFSEKIPSKKGERMFVDVFLKGDSTMADVNKAAQDKAQSDHNSGQSAPNMTNWSPGARDAYQTQRDWIQRQEDAKKSSQA